MLSIFWRIFWRTINRRALYVVKKRGIRQESGGWVYQTSNMRIEAPGTAVRVSVPVRPGETALVDDGNKYWRIVYWLDNGVIKIWKFGPWAKQIGQVCWRIKRHNRGKIL